MSETETVTRFYMASAGNCPSFTHDTRIVNPSFFYNKNVTQINKNFDDLEKSYYLCSKCEKLSMFNSGWKGETVTDNYILGCFKKCTEANNTFSYLPKIETVDFEFTECVKAIENFRGCENITSANVNYPKCLVFNGEFVGCKSLNELNISLENVICGKQAFEGCESLTSYMFPLQKLLCGVNMFKGCNLDTASVDCILESLPTITIDGVKLNDYSLDDEVVNRYLTSFSQDNYKVIRNKTIGKFEIQKNGEPFHEVNFCDFGIINLGVQKGDTDWTMDLMAKGMKPSTKFTRNIEQAKNKGWKIIYNGKTIENK